MPRLVLFRVVAPSLPDTGSTSQEVSLPARRWTHRRRSRPTRSGPAHEKPTVSSRPLSSASRRLPTPQVHSLTTSHARWFRRPWLGPTSHLCNAPCRVLVRRTLDTRGRPSRLAPRHPVDQLRPLRRWHAGMHPGRVRFGRRTARLPSQLADEGAPCARGMAMEWELDLDAVNLEVNSVGLWVVHRGHREGSPGVTPVWRRDAPIPTERGGVPVSVGGSKGPGGDPVVQQRVEETRTGMGRGSPASSGRMSSNGRSEGEMQRGEIGHSPCWVGHVGPRGIGSARQRGTVETHQVQLVFHLVFGGSPASPWNRNTREGTDADRRSLSFPTKPMRKTIRSTQGPNSEGSEPGWIRDTRRSTHLVPERKEADPTPALVEERHRRNQGKGGGRGTTAVDEVSEGRIASTGPTTRSQRRGKKNRGYRRRRRTRVRS